MLKPSNGPAQIALRTYLLALSLSLGPSLLPLTSRGSGSSPNATGKLPGTLKRLMHVLKRELSLDGFAFAMTLAVAGGELLRKYPISLNEFGRGSDSSRLAAVEGSQSNILARLTHKVASNFARLLECKLSEEQQTFFAYILSSSLCVLVLQAGRERRYTAQKGTKSSAASPTLDLTLLLLVRAVDAVVQYLIIRASSDSEPPVYRGPESFTNKREEQNVIVSKGSTALLNGHNSETSSRSDLEHADKSKQEKLRTRRSRWTSRVDAFVFWACSARIMWCFFYEPERLPRSYVTWIQRLANLDYRIIQTLQLIRANQWSYSQSPPSPLLLQETAIAQGYPASWGDPSLLPAYGGNIADQAWKNLGVTSRPGVGGVPCEVLHAPFGRTFGLEESCAANATLRLLYGFSQALAIYLPVHFLPTLLTRPRTLLHRDRLKQTLLRTVRSASFLSSFIGLYWSFVCLTRTFFLPKLFPRISHNFWDGPYGCIMAGCVACGSSIWVEEGRRRGEMALYVIPRAIRTCLPETWVRCRAKSVERLIFILSMATLLTAASHRPDTLRGLSHWTLTFITAGPNAGFWKGKRKV